MPHDSETTRSAWPAASWGATEHLLAAVVDVLAVANWQRGGDPNAKRPKPLPRPGERQAMQSKLERLKAQREAKRRRKEAKRGN